MPKRKYADITQDDDLMCLICHELVDGAVQSPCCGSLFCLQCVNVWIEGNKTCPSCRIALKSEELQRDVRTDRKAANMILPCKKVGRNNCTFKGNRQERKVHENMCGKTVKELMEENITLQDKVKKIESKYQLQEKEMKEKIAQAAYNSSSKVLAALFDSELASVFQYHKNKVYNLNFNIGKKHEYELYWRMLDQHSNVSLGLFLNVDEDEKCADDVPHVECVCTLIHPYNVELNKSYTVNTSDLSLKSRRRLKCNFLTSRELKKYVYDEKICLCCSVNGKEDYDDIDDGPSIH